MNGVCNDERASQAHSHKSPTEDEMMMVQDLRKIKPFETKPGRKHAHFDKIQATPTSKLDMKSLFIWLEKRKKQIAMGKNNL